VHVRFSGALSPIMEAMRTELRLLDEDLPIIGLTTMERITERALRQERVTGYLFSGFSAVALFLAALGVYGVLAHSVLERTREFGVRLAVGAGPWRMVGMVLAESLKTSAAGIVAGLFLAIPVQLAIRSLLLGVSPLDPLSLGGSVVVLATAALAAGLVPAVRAARMDPLRSLTGE